MLKLYSTLNKRIEEFKSVKKNEVGLYTCGPTVYGFAHIGNLRTYIFEDILHRILEYNGYKVDHAMNITDVGHLVGDGDEGEDKLEVGAKREGKSPLEIAKVYADKFFSDLDGLNIIRPNKILSATQSIPEQIEIIKILEEKGFAYKGEQAVYFDTSKFHDYGNLSGQRLSEKKTGAREEVVIDKDKKHPADFALWFFLTGRYKNHVLHWPSPWGEGFPGWHIECSAISRKLLGQPFDIHSGGVDHIGTHHTNEIAQSEAAFGLPLCNYWLHGEFLLIDSGRMGKSEGNLLTLDALKEKGFSPLDYRYMCLQAHYRTQLNFTWEGLLAAHNAFERLAIFAALEKPGQVGCAEYEQKFKDAINDDLNLPKALGIVWELVSDDTMPAGARINSLLNFDEVFGLKLSQQPLSIRIETLPALVADLLGQRAMARSSMDYQKSDELRKQIEGLGYEIEDTPNGHKVKRKPQI
ncbi:MAG: cysteine--tRNA ligase [Candidatus Doudnabacteria bacterium]|nr:cysteine--tRNA ligase [Candidatus Doudnabacteria bacterium]